MPLLLLLLTIVVVVVAIAAVADAIGEFDVLDGEVVANSGTGAKDGEGKALLHLWKRC